KMSSVIIYLVILIGMVVSSFTSPLLKIVLDYGVPSDTVTFFRLAVAGGMLIPIILGKPSYRRELRNATKKDMLLMVGGGILRATNMLLWVTALKYSPVFLVSALMRTNPIWVIVASYLFLGESTPLKSLIGVAICLAGVALCALGGASDATNNPIGMVLILISAVLFALNMVLSRELRKTFSLWPSLGIPYCLAAIILFGVCLIQGSSFGPFPPMAWVIIAILSGLCTLAPQSITVWAVKYISATAVSLVNLLSPFIAGVTAFFLTAEVPNTLTIIGCIVMVVGLFLYFYLESRAKLTAAQKKEEQGSFAPEALPELELEVLSPDGAPMDD
ncbi:DMT family transporter, partial [Eubacteriales bacterium OttesenSCG-928-M02]|nr:DMT family transporter [Eubacteriales bacterium OttesenSCG-928-M02]